MEKSDVLGYLNGEYLENNDKGKSELAGIKRLFKGTDFKVVARPRNPNRRKAIEEAGLTYSKKYRQDIPVKLATRFSIYIVSKSTGKQLKDISLNDSKVAELYRLQHMNNILAAKVMELESKLALSEEIISNVKKALK